MIFPSPLHNMIFFPNRLDKLPHPPPPLRGDKDLIHFDIVKRRTRTKNIFSGSCQEKRGGIETTKNCKLFKYLLWPLITGNFKNFSNNKESELTAMKENNVNYNCHFVFDAFPNMH